MNLRNTSQHIFCATHPEEPIMRVSTNHEDSKLFYCHDCLSGTSSNNTLVKFNDLIKTLQNEYSSQEPPQYNNALAKDILELYTNKNQTESKFNEVILKQNLKADEEINKIQNQMIKLLKKVRGIIHDRLDQYENSFIEMVDNYLNQIQMQEKVLANSIKEVPTQEQLVKRIFNGKTAEEAETNLRSVFEELKTMKEIKDGTAIKGLISTKNTLEQISESTDVISKKDENFYVTTLSSLENYLKSILYEIKENKEDNKNEDNKSTEQLKLQQVLLRNLGNIYIYFSYLQILSNYWKN